MNNQKWWTTGSTSSGLQEGAIAELRAETAPRHTAESPRTPLSHPLLPGRLNPFLVTSQDEVTPAWEAAEGEHPLSWLIPAWHFAPQSNSVGDTSLVLKWSIFPSPQPWLGSARPAHSHSQGHHVYIHFKYREVIHSPATARLSDA